MVYKCNNCGNEFYNSKGFCPHCGINITNNNENMKFLCPICNNMIDYDSVSCGNCGFKITKDVNYIIKESKSKSCQNCGYKNNMDAKFCENCGENLPLTSDLHLIECPDCKQKVRDDVNYCRFCGHSFLKEKRSLFPKRPNSLDRYCQNCGTRINISDRSRFCKNCGSGLPFDRKDVSNQFTNHEENIVLLTNQLFVPLSMKHNVNFRKVPIRDHFNISSEQESHIFYRIIEKSKNSPNEDMVSYFEHVLEETKGNSKDIEDAIIKNAMKSLTDSFNGLGLTSTEVLTIKDDYYETVETPVVQNKHGGLTKGVATLGLGLIGYAATSGVKQTTSTKKVFNKGDFLHSLMTISSEYIVVKTYTDNSNEKTFHSNRGNINKTVIYWQDVNCVDHENYLILNTGETFKLPQYDVSSRINNAIDKVVGTLDLDLNTELRKKYYPKVFPTINNVLPNLINDTIVAAKEKMNANDVVEGIMSNDLTDAQNQIQSSGMLKCPNCGKLNSNENKFCGECGSKLETIADYCPNCDKTYFTGEKFCTQCGTKLTTKN